MRLIDAGAMYKRYCVDKEGLDGIYDATDLPDMLASMPTIGAIPMDWLKQSRDKLRTMGEYQQDCADAIEFVLRLWQKEQGAKA